MLTLWEGAEKASQNADFMGGEKASLVRSMCLLVVGRKCALVDAIWFSPNKAFANPEFIPPKRHDQCLSSIGDYVVICGHQAKLWAPS
jgi:hypothetical protein